ncbi:hypothetical protein LINGRAHAP2_LOCUS2022 [Linum grandiflorum]
MRADKGKGNGLVISDWLNNRDNITSSARRVIFENENEQPKKRKKKPIVYREPKCRPDITIPTSGTVMHDRVVSDDDETDVGYEESLQGDLHHVDLADRNGLAGALLPVDVRHPQPLRDLGFQTMVQDLLFHLRRLPHLHHGHPYYCRFFKELNMTIGLELLDVSSLPTTEKEGFIECSSSNSPYLNKRR